MKQQKQACRKKPYEKVAFQYKLLVVDQIQNGQISANYASKKYNISRSTIAYWLQKHSTLDQQNTGMNVSIRSYTYCNNFKNEFNL